MSKEILDVAIIGAGAAGTYSAWRLANDDKYDNSKIKVFDFLKIEGKRHVGGRLWSTHLPGLGHTRKAEVGGMRYLTSQEIVTNVVNELGFKDVPFDVDSKDNLYDLRSTIIRSEDITDSDQVPYNLGPMEKGQSPGGLLLYAVETIIPNAPYLTKEEWLEVKKNFKVDGYNLYEMGFWNLLERVLSQEGYNYVYEGQGYNTVPSNWNAADAMEWILEDFAADASYRYVHKGYQSVPETLLTLAEEKGVEMQEDSKLKSWRRADDGIIDMVFESTTDKGGDFTVRAKKMILAVPKRALELIDMPKDESAQVFYNELLPSVEPQPMFKFFVGYKYPWWRTLGMTSGRTITDNPLRQIYYWGSNYQHFFKDAPEETRGEPNSPENSLIMVYLDGRDVSFWQPLFELLDVHSRHLNVQSESNFEVMKVFSADVNDFLGELRNEISDDLQKLQDNDQTNDQEAMIDLVRESEILKQKLGSIKRSQAAMDNLIVTISNLLMRAHGIGYIPQPYSFAFADWTVDPFGGAYNLWKPGFKSWEVTEQIIKPFPDTHAYIVGEAYSLKQGWVEGAFETAEQMLETYFDLDQPSWLTKPYKIGKG